MPVEKKNLTPPISKELATQPISRFMTQRVVAATPATTVRMAMQMMISQKISGLAVVGPGGACIGVYSEFDAMLQGSSQDLDKPIRYSKPPCVCTMNTSFRDALLLLVKKKVKRLPVLDGRKRLVGVVTRHDFMKAIYADQPHENAK